MRNTFETMIIASAVFITLASMEQGSCGRMSLSIPLVEGCYDRFLQVTLRWFVSSQSLCLRIILGLIKPELARPLEAELKEGLPVGFSR
jgi:hypothetical protein